MAMDLTSLSWLLSFPVGCSSIEEVSSTTTTTMQRSRKAASTVTTPRASPSPSSTSASRPTSKATHKPLSTLTATPTTSTACAGTPLLVATTESIKMRKPSQVKRLKKRRAKTHSAKAVPHLPTASTSTIHAAVQSKAHGVPAKPTMAKTKRSSSSSSSLSSDDSDSHSVATNSDVELDMFDADFALLAGESDSDSLSTSPSSFLDQIEHDFTVIPSIWMPSHMQQPLDTSEAPSFEDLFFGVGGIDVSSAHNMTIDVQGAFDSSDVARSTLLYSF
eukprot:m.39433 g.39433  ORF g.39433 m.39433 type:complete len:276 (-) comp10308_c0_seq2:2279-3106(-)